MNCELMMEVWPRVKTCLVISCGVDATLFLWYWSARTLLWRRNCCQWPRVVSSFHRLGFAC